MSSEWDARPLRDCAKWMSGGTPATSNPDYWGGDIPWISAASLTDFRIRHSDRRVTRLGAENGTRLVPPGSVLFVVRGMSLKSEFRVGISMREVAFGQDCKALLPAEDVDPSFLAYAIKGRTADILNLVDEAGHGTGRLQTELLESLEIGVPVLHEQRRIAGVLGALDDKIEQNRRLVRSAIALARAIASARCNVSCRVGDVAEIEKGLSYQGAGLGKAGLPMFNLANFTVDGWLNRAAFKFYSGDSRRRHLVGPGDLLLANTDLTQRRAILGQPVLVPDVIERALFTHHVYCVRFKEGFECLLYALYFGLQSRAFRDRAENYASGTTVAALPRDAVLDFEFLAPSKHDLQLLNAQVSALIRQAWRVEEESAVLADLRDVLLPKLVSGEIRVPENYEPSDAMGTAA